MARYSLAFAGITPVAVADTAAYTDNGYPFFLQGGTSTQRLEVQELSVSGEASTSTVNRMIFARDSTVGATSISGNRMALADGSAVAPATAPVQGAVSTTKPQRSATLYLAMPVLNTYGGIYRWQARPGEEFSIVGNTASLGEASLSSVSGTGVVSGHCIFEAR